jgi:hypothetical protein
MVLITGNHYHPSQIFVVKVESLPLEWSHVRVSSKHACTYLTKMKVVRVTNTIAYHENGINCGSKIFIIATPGASVAKLFASIIYECS